MLTQRFLDWLIDFTILSYMIQYEFLHSQEYCHNNHMKPLDSRENISIILLDDSEGPCDSRDRSI